MSLSPGSTISGWGHRSCHLGGRSDCGLDWCGGGEGVGRGCREWVAGERVGWKTGGGVFMFGFRRVKILCVFCFVGLGLALFSSFSAFSRGECVR